MLAVGLREHHQLDVGRIAADPSARTEGIDQVVDLVVGQREAPVAVRGHQRVAAAGDQVDGLQRFAFDRIEQTRQVEVGVDDDLGHPIVQHGRDARAHRVVDLRPTEEAAVELDRVCDTALDPLDRVEPAAMRDVGGLAGPRRQGAEPRQDDERFRACRRRCGRRAVVEERVELFALGGGQRARRRHHVHRAGGQRSYRDAVGLQRLDQPVDAKGESARPPSRRST